MTADPAMTGGYNMAQDAMRALHGNVIGTMMDYGGEQAMETMAYMMSTGDADTSAMILETVMEHTTMDPMMTGDMYYDPYMMSDPYAMDPTMMDPGMMVEEENFALALLDEMAEVDPDMMNEIYEQQADLMDNMFDTAFSSSESVRFVAISLLNHSRAIVPVGLGIVLAHSRVIKKFNPMFSGGVIGVSVITLFRQEVPRIVQASPGLIVPLPIREEETSASPAITGVPVAIPVISDTLRVIAPAILEEETTGGNKSMASGISQSRISCSEKFLL